jgi:zinc protease
MTSRSPVGGSRQIQRASNLTRLATFALAAVTLILSGATIAAQNTAFDRSKPPELGPAPSLRMPPITERTLGNGLRLIVVEQHELPLVDITLTVRSGSESDPTGKAGLATLTGSLLREGAGARSSQDIAEQEAFLGVDLTTGASWDQSIIGVHAPTAVLDSALALFADVVLRPTFPQNEFDRLRKQRLTSLLQVKDRGPAMADRAFNILLFSPDHPYGHPSQGVESTVESFTRDDVVSFHNAIYRPNNAFLLVVGDVRPADIEQRVKRLLSGWERADVTAPTMPATAATAAPGIYVVDKPGAPQSSFRIGAIGVARSTPDYYALQVLNTILGGAFTSRLNMNLREKRGYTYGAGSVFVMRRDRGPFFAAGEINAPVSDSALVQFMAELGNIHTPVPAEELEKAKKYLQLGLPGDFESLTDISAQLSTYALYDLPLDEPTRAVQKIGAVTAEDVTRVANTYLDPARMIIVVAGDASKLVPALRRTGFGAVSVVDSYGKAVK